MNCFFRVACKESDGESARFYIRYFCNITISVIRLTETYTNGETKGDKHAHLKSQNSFSKRRRVLFSGQSPNAKHAGREKQFNGLIACSLQGTGL